MTTAPQGTYRKQPKAPGPGLFLVGCAIGVAFIAMCLAWS